MDNFNRKEHWEKIYRTKPLEEVSWYEPTPETSLEFIEQFNLPTTAKIIDIGGGDCFLVDHLLKKGFKDITVLDISEAAIERAKRRLGGSAEKVKWIVADAANFKYTEQYDLWHDRAAFHFLTSDREITSYLETAQRAIKPQGALIIGTFSEQGPKKCSGIEIKQYSEDSMTDLFKKFFEKIRCITVDHRTPSGTKQNFVFCSFKRISTLVV